MWGAIGAIGSSLLGGLFGSSGEKKRNKAQIAAAREQMAFQERMSNTAHQRQVADLQAAGINPILSAKLGGADSPGGAQPNITNEMAPMANAAQSMGDKLYNFKVQTAQVDNMKLQNDLLREQVEQLSISNARQGLLTPAWETGGRVVDQVMGGVNRLLGGDDIVQDVLDAAGTNNTGISPGGSSAKNFDGRYTLPVGTKNSEARKWASGEKSFWQSLRDANKDRGHAALTEEKLRAYGLRRLEEIRRKQRSDDGYFRLKLRKN